MGINATRKEKTHFLTYKYHVLPKFCDTMTIRSQKAAFKEDWILPSEKSFKKPWINIFQNAVYLKARKLIRCTKEQKQRQQKHNSLVKTQR